MHLKWYMKSRKVAELFPMLGSPKDILVIEPSFLAEVFNKLNVSWTGTIFVTDRARRVVGYVTDGDIRRQLLAAVTSRSRFSLS